ncbi:MAG: histidine kinase [Pseudoxanthomonas sp.]
MPTHSTRTTSKLFWAVLLWWAVYSAISATQFVAMGDTTGNPIGWAEALRYGFGGNMPWVPFTLGLLWLARRYPIEREHALRAIGIHALGVAAIIVVKAAYICATNRYFVWYDALPGFGEVVVTSIRNNVMTAWTVVGVCHALVFYQRARERERDLADMEKTLVAAKLDALRAQINPHFLFNALNSVAEMVHVDKDLADAMLVSLSALLRDGLAREERQVRPLREEIALVEHYLLIEKIRLAERLSVAWDVDRTSLDAPVPVLILQPLVENAIVHAIAPSKAAGSVTIRAHNANGMLRLCVENSIDEDTEAAAGNGVGLRSVSDRLELLYGEQARLVRHEADPGRYVVELHIPQPRGGESTEAFTEMRA